MGLAPLLDAPDIFLVAEVVSVGRFGQPAALTGGIAGAATFGFKAIGLMIGVAVLSSEKLLAATALTTIWLWNHASDSERERKNLNRFRRRRDQREEGRNFLRSFQRKFTPKKTEF